MKVDLEPAKEVLRLFLEEIDSIKEIRKSISAPVQATSFAINNRMPEFHLEFTPAPDSLWERENAYFWIYAASRYTPLIRRPKQHKVNPFYEQAAYPLFDEWDHLERDVRNFPSYCIQPPEQEETLHVYLEKLRSTVVDEGERRKIWWLSLRSFTDFLRKKAKLIELWGNLDIIFPEEMTIYSDTIIRRVLPTVYPIDILATAEILQNLARLVFEGPPHSQKSAAEALGLAWVCLSSGLHRFMTRVEILHQLFHNCPKPIPQSDPFKPNYWLTIRTLFGKQYAPISKTLYDYLLALPHSHPYYLFGMPLGSLRRTLNRAIDASERAKNLGKITFLTFMSEPHEAIGHRFKAYDKYQLKSTS